MDIILVELDEKNVLKDPILQFAKWYKYALNKKVAEPAAMLVASVDRFGNPDTRIVLLKEFNQSGFIFYTNYRSPKAIQFGKNGKVALNFYWPSLKRQIRIKGSIKKVSYQKSADYFSSRPRESQINTLASNQSKPVKDKKTLLLKTKTIEQKFAGKAIPCPLHWGGYLVVPYEFEFFEGRKNRLNNRVRYQKKQGKWLIKRLFP